MSLSSRIVVSWVLTFLFVGFVALIGIVVMNLWLGERTQTYSAQAGESRDIRAAAVDLRSAIQTAESSQRGYMIDGNEVYLAPFDVAKTQASRKLDTLKTLIAPYGEFQRSAERLTSIWTEKVDEMDRIIALKRARNDAEALSLFRSNRGKALMDEANIFLNGIIVAVEDRLDAGVEEQRNNAALLRLVSAIGALVIVAVIGGAVLVLLRYTSELRQTRDELNSLNAALESRVEERTADLVQARDRAQVLLSEVNHRVANSLALVSSLVTLQSRAVKDEAARRALAETQDRIFAISLIHKRLYDSKDARNVTLDVYLSSLFDHLKTSLKSEGQGVDVTYDLAPVALPTDASVNLGVIATEWVTNAFKYAYPAGGGSIRVNVRQLPDGLVELVVEDDGVGKAEGAPAKGTGLGSRIVTAMAASLGGEANYEQRNPGTAARLSFRPRPVELAAQ
ncbi:MAG: CHASE3 domain-containing protein [Devosia sp.]